MSADILISTELLSNGPDLTYGPHYEGVSRLLDIPSERFYAVTGIPVKKEGDVPPHMDYLDSASARAPRQRVQRYKHSSSQCPR